MLFMKFSCNSVIILSSACILYAEGDWALFSHQTIPNELNYSRTVCNELSATAVGLCEKSITSATGTSLIKCTRICEKDYKRTSKRNEKCSITINLNP
jgi:hypothetical protein